MFDRRFERINKIIEKEIVENSRILVAGLGGVGGYALETLARLGVNELHIIDNDIVDITNINRQIIALDSTIGLPKVDVFESRIKDINPNCKVLKYNLFIDKNNIGDLLDEIKPDYILDCIDSLKSKEELIYVAYRKKLKIVSSMGTANKIDASLIKVDKLSNTSVCPIARILRKNLKDRGVDISKIRVVFSTEVPRLRSSLGSSSVVPSASGVNMTSFVLRDLLKANGKV